MRLRWLIKSLMLLLLASLLATISIELIAYPTNSAKPTPRVVKQTHQASRKKKHRTRTKKSRPRKKLAKKPKKKVIIIPARKIKPLPMTGTEVAGMEKFEKKFLRMLRKWHIPGAAIAIMEDDELVYSRGFGWADIDKDIPVKPNSLFRIASVSKAITAVSILKLVEMGKLSLDDKVFEILNDIEPFPGKKINPKLKSISVRNLLHMSSGLLRKGRGHFDPMFGPWPRSVRKRLEPATLPASCYDMTRLMLSYPLRYPPGRGYAYSNLDYCILGLIINKITQTPYGHDGYQTFVNRAVMNPLNIHDMSIASTLRHQSRPNEVTYYYYLGARNPETHRRSTYLPYSDDQVLQKNFANGGWVASAPDLVHFVHDVSNEKVLAPHLYDEMLSPPTYANKNAKHYFGMGWRVRHRHEQKFWLQSGSFTGTNSLVLHRPDGLVIAVVFNSRPPAWHLFRNMRPRLKKMLHSVQ